MDKSFFRDAEARKSYAPLLEVSAPEGSLPSSFDWRNNKTPVVTPVKNQEQCGSCWAFSTTENIESVWALAGNPLVSLAPQQVRC
jgi:C1A family cysteine protease